MTVMTLRYHCSNEFKLRHPPNEKVHTHTHTHTLHGRRGARAAVLTCAAGDVAVSGGGRGGRGQRLKWRLGLLQADVT